MQFWTAQRRKVVGFLPRPIVADFVVSLMITHYWTSVMWVISSHGTTAEWVAPILKSSLIVAWQTNSGRYYTSNATVTHLTAIQSNHRPILLHLDPPIGNMPKPFKFESMWTLHPDTGLIIQHVWHISKPFTSKLKDTKVAPKKWNKEVFGQLQSKISKLKKILEAIQNDNSETNLTNLEATVQNELDVLLKQEELLWRTRLKQGGLRMRMLTPDIITSLP